MSGIPANTINGLAQQQLAHAASFQSYSNFLSDTYGTRKTPTSQAAVSGGGAAGMDPRYQPYLPGMQPFSAQTGMAAGIMGRMPGVADGLGTAASLGGAFGFLPRVFDPFTQTLGMIGSGFRAGGIGGAVGYGMASAGAYMGLGAAANMSIGQIMGGAGEQASLSGVLSQGWNRPNLPMMQGGMPSFGQQVGLGNMMSNMAGQDPMMSMGSLQGILAQGLQGGSFSSSRNFGQFASQFKELVNEVRQVAETFNTSLSDAYAVSQRIKSMGFYGKGEAGQAAMALRGMGTAAGMQADEVMSSMQSGADMWTQLGGSRKMGAATGLGVTTQIMSMAQSGILDPNQLRDAMGGVPLGQAAVGMGQRMLGYGARFAGTRHGRRVVGAMMDPETGELDPSQLAAFPSMSWGEIESAYSQRTGGARGGDLFRSRFSSLSRGMNEQLGPAWWSTAIKRMSMQQGGSASGEELLTSIYGNMPQGDMDVMNRLGTFGSSAKSYVQNRTELALRHSIDEAQSARDMSWAGIRGKMRQAFVDPITQPLRRMGREAFGSMQEWSGGMIDSFLGLQPAAQMTSAGAYTLGNLRSGVGGGFPTSAISAAMGTGSYQPGPAGGFESGINRFMPAGAWTGYSGGSFATGGLGSSQWNPYSTGILAASLPVFGGASAIGGVGGALQSVGGALSGAGGWLGRGSGALVSGAGLATSGAASAIGRIAPALFAADLAFNAAPALLRNLDTPRAAIMEGGITGDLANSLYGFNRGATSGTGSLGSFSGVEMRAGGVPLLHDPSLSPRGGFRGFVENMLQPGANLLGSWMGDDRGYMQIGFGSQAGAGSFLGALRGIRNDSSGMLGLTESEQSYLTGSVRGLPGASRVPGSYERQRSEALMAMLQNANNPIASGLIEKSQGVAEGLGGLALYAAGGGDATSMFTRGIDSVQTRRKTNTEMWRAGISGLVGDATLTDKGVAELSGGASAFVSRGRTFGLMEDIMLWEQSTAVDKEAKFEQMVSSIASGGRSGSYAPPGVLSNLQSLVTEYRGSTGEAKEKAKADLVGRFQAGAQGNQPLYIGEFETAKARSNVARSWGARVGLRGMLGTVSAGNADNLYRLVMERSGPLAAEANKHGVPVLEEHTRERNQAFWNMGMDDIRGTVAMGRSAPTEARGFFDDAGTHARIRGILSESMGMGRDTYDEMEGLGGNDVLLGRKGLPGLMRGLFAGADRGTYANFERHLPSFTSKGGQGSRYAIELMKTMSAQMGLGNDNGFVRSVATAVSSQGEKGSNVTKMEYQDIVNALADAIKTQKPGGVGAGTADDTTAKNMERLAKAAEEAATWLHEMRGQGGG